MAARERPCIHRCPLDYAPLRITFKLRDTALFCGVPLEVAVNPFQERDQVGYLGVGFAADTNQNNGVCIGILALRSRTTMPK
jgi:hypothetical protein